MPVRRLLRLALLSWLAIHWLAAPIPRPLHAAEPGAAEERAARLADRYKAMLAANPVEGSALDRLWKSSEERGATGPLLEEYRLASEQPTAANASTAPATLLVYGHLLKKAGRFDEAAVAYQRATTLDPANPLPPLALADLASARGKPADAADLYDSVLAKLPAGDPKRPGLLLKTGAAWQAAGQPDKAAARWEAMVVLDPANLAQRRELAANYEKNNLPGRAIGHYDYIEKHGAPADRAQALRDLGRLHEARGEFDPARDALERGLALTARDNWLHAEMENRLIRLYQCAGRVAELESSWQTAVAENPRDLGACLRLVRLAEAQADAPAQRAALRRVIDLSPRDRDSALKLARLLANAGERAQAATLYDQLLASQPDNLDLLLARADLDLQLDRADAAVARIEARAARSPGDESVSTPALEFFLGHHLAAAAERRLRADAARQPDADDPQFALAKFLFAQRQPVEGRAALEALAARPGDPVARAARLGRVAEVYKEQNDPGDALRCWRLASEIQPLQPAPLLATADLLLARGDAEGGRAALERAVGLTAEGPERIETERKLFQALQAAGAEAGAARKPVPDALPLARYLDQFAAAAKSSPTALSYTRLARWSQWARDLPAALAAGETAARIDPRDLPSREMLASMAMEGRQREVAERWLREIMAIDPSRQARCLKQIAKGRLDEGDFDTALAAFTDLQRAAPGSIPALTDLALAQQRADRWFDALATWERAYALPGATPAQRAEIRQPLLVALTQLNRFPRVAEVLQAAIDEAADAKQDLFRELAAFCRSHGLGETLRADYEARLKAGPQDWFVLTALAEMRRDAGRERDAYNLLGQARYAAPDPARASRALVDAAESLGLIDEAVDHQRHLIASTGQGTLENLEKLASLEDSGSEADASVRTWENIAARFPREPLALGHASAFFEAVGDTVRARDLLDQLARINAADNRQLFHLGELSVAVGNPEAGRAAYEQVLARAEPEKPGDRFTPPADLDRLPPLDAAVDAGELLIARRLLHTGRTVAMPSGVVPPADGDSRLRLKAIRELTCLLFPIRPNNPSPPGAEAAQRQWLARWRDAEKAGARAEPLWAYFYAGQGTLVMDCLARWLEKDPADAALRQAFLGLGLRLREYRRVAAWTWSPDPANGGTGARGRELVQSLSQWLVGPDIQTGGNLVADLFPPEAKARDSLWLAASNVFAARQRYAEACELGARLFAASPRDYRAAYGVELGRWLLVLGHLDQARETLRRVFMETEGASLERSGVFGALREYTLLLPAGERRAFAEGYLARSREKSSAPHAVLSALLLHGLLGDEPAARRDIDALLKMRLLAGEVEEGGGSPDSRRWSHVLANGLQLQTWNLPSLAAYLWRHALAEATAFDRQMGDSQQVLAEIRGQMLLNDVALASGPQEGREAVDDYLRSRPGAGGAASIAAQLLSASRFAEAARVFEYLCQAEPGAGEHWQERFNALKAAGDEVAAERLWRELLEARVPWPPGLNRFGVARQLAGLLETELADPASARQLWWREHASGDRAMEGVLSAELARSYERTEQWENAALAWKEAALNDPTSADAVALAKIEAERLHHPDDALARLQRVAERNLSPAEHTRVALATAEIQLAAGHADEALEAGFDLLRRNQPDALSGVASRLSRAGAGSAARQLLTAATRRATEPQARLGLQRALVEQVAEMSGGGDALFKRELRRLRTFAEGTTPLRAMFDDACYDLSRKRHLDGWLEAELARDWREGRGRSAAGEDLARLYLDTGRDAFLKQTIGQILARPDFGEPALVKIRQALAEGGKTALAAEVARALFSLNPRDDGHALAYARALWLDNRREEARGFMASLASGEVARENIGARVGKLCLELGDKPRAREYLDRAVAADPLAARAPQAFLELAGLELDAGEIFHARGYLRAAYRNPACDDFKPLVRYLCTTTPPGSDALGRLGASDFPLNTIQRARLLPLLAEALETAGRGADAAGLVATHPEWLAANPVYVGALRGKLPSGDLRGLTELAAKVEAAVSQSELPNRELNRQLAAIYTQMAGQELLDGKGGSAAVDSATAHLTRALALAPAYFPAADRLACLQMERKQEARAAETLRDFLTPEALPEERAEAMKILRGA